MSKPLAKIYNETGHSFASDLDGVTIKDAINTLTEMMKRVGENAMLTVVGNNDDYGGHIESYITYLETDEEYEQRIQASIKRDELAKQAKIDQRKRNKEKRLKVVQEEKALLKKLKEKYPDA